MESKLSDVERRVRRYWFTDGLGELIGGGMFILMGIYFGLQEYLGQNSMLGGILQVSLVLVLVGGMYVSRRLINALKARVTYPRTGYVEYQADEHNLRSRRIWVAVLAFAIAALTMVFVNLFQFFDAIVAVTGVAVGLILITLRAKASGMARFYVLGAISIVLGLALSISKLPDGYSLGYFYGLMGLSFLLSGGLTLQRYLEENPLPGDGEGSNG